MKLFVAMLGNEYVGGETVVGVFDNEKTARKEANKILKSDAGQQDYDSVFVLPFELNQVQTPYED
jgi:hypothetical protein